MYYILSEKDNYFADAGHIDSYPELPMEIGFRRGQLIDKTKLKIPVRCDMDPEWGEDLTIIMGIRIPMMRSDMVEILIKTGVNNLQLFDAIIVNPYTGTDVTNYKAVNIIGLVSAADEAASDFKAFSDPPRIDTIFRDLVIDPTKAQGQLMFRLAEDLSIIVHEKIKEALEPSFPSLTFQPTSK